MKRNILLSCFLFFVLSWFSAGYGIYYRIPCFARPAALGEAFVGISENATSIFYNPAGPSSKTVSFSLTEWFLDTRAGSVAGSYNYKNYFTFGAGFSYFSYGQLRYFNEEGNPGDYFSAGLWQGKISLSKQFFNLVSIGIAPKIISQKIDTISTTKTGFDIGVLSSIKLLNVGVSIRDLGIDELYDFGISMKPLRDLLLTTDINYQDEIKFGAGAEYYFKPVYFRIGYNDKKLSCGIGYTQKGFLFDYALSDYGQIGLMHQFSITIK